MTMLWAAFLFTGLLGESLTWPQIVGGGLVIAGVVVLQG
jgi:drug/metabolite transporter (DMT)-like permease